jgi:glycerol uptake facilitator-like aquaporin
MVPTGRGRTSAYLPGHGVAGRRSPRPGATASGHLGDGLTGHISGYAIEEAEPPSSEAAGYPDPMAAEESFMTRRSVLPISGSHVNPAVTAGALLTGRILLTDAVGYWIAQFAGGIAGALVLWATFSDSPLYHRSTTGLGADGWGHASLMHIGVGGAFGFEVILTALFVVLRVTSATANAATAAIAIGLSLTVVHLAGIPVTGTSVNPARSLGPALVVGGTALSQVWLFIVARWPAACSRPACTASCTGRKTSGWPPRRSRPPEPATARSRSSRFPRPA